MVSILNRNMLKKANHKPGSVSFLRTICHLSRLIFTNKLNRPTLQDQASSPQALVYMVFQSVRFTLPPLSPKTR